MGRVQLRVDLWKLYGSGWCTKYGVFTNFNSLIEA
jgi:hypothetical protein